jgi:thiamine kinase-like enzyme
MAEPVIQEISNVRRSWSREQTKRYVEDLLIWKDDLASVDQIMGGLQNRTYFATKKNGEKFAVRIGFDQYRTRQTSVVQCTMAAHKLGMGPRLVYAEPNLSVTEFQPGVRMTLEQMQDRQVMNKVISAMKVIHNGSWAIEETISYWWPFDTVRRYLSSMEKGKEANGFAHSEWANLVPRYRDITDRLEKAISPFIPKFTHNDMVFPNMFIQADGDIKFIDWDGGAYGHPMWDLGEMLMWAEADETVTRDAIKQYYDEISELDIDLRLREIRAFQIMAALRLVTEVMETELDPYFFLSPDEMSESMKIVLPDQTPSLRGLAELVMPRFEELWEKYGPDYVSTHE